MKAVINGLAAVGTATVACLAALGNFSLFALALMRHVAILLRKPLLTLRATYAAGVLSLPIIL
ncbi:MAG: ABC transporter permease, partial [Cardiobacterium sp.]